jgi:hypothetical protein
LSSLLTLALTLTLTITLIVIILALTLAPTLKGKTVKLTTQNVGYTNKIDNMGEKTAVIYKKPASYGFGTR